MEYVRLGNSDIQVSRFCLGCMSFGDPASKMHAWTLNADESEKIIRHALDLGINFLRISIGIRRSRRKRGRIFSSYISPTRATPSGSRRSSPMRRAVRCGKSSPKRPIRRRISIIRTATAAPTASRTIRTPARRSRTKSKILRNTTGYLSATPSGGGTRRASFRPFSKAIRSRTKGYIPFPRAGRAAGTGRITDCGRAIRRSILRGICILPLPGSRPRRPASPTGFRKSFPQRPHKD